jgi:transcriptional regulator with XRE-family HTH domain
MKLETELYNIMQQEKLTNAKLASKLGISPSMLCLVLTGDKNPGRRFLQGLAQHYPDICLKYLQDQIPAKTSNS